MTQGLTLHLARCADDIARAYHPRLYASVHEIVADLPTTEAFVGGPYFRRAVKVWFAEGERVLNLVYCEHAGDDEQLLAELQKGLNKWAALEQAPEDSLALAEVEAEKLLQLVTHPLTASADRVNLLRKFMGWHNRREARELAADLTAKIEARSPGALTGVGWMPHGKVAPRESPHPFPAN